MTVLKLRTKENLGTEGSVVRDQSLELSLEIYDITQMMRIVFSWTVKVNLENTTVEDLLGFMKKQIFSPF